MKAMILAAGMGKRLHPLTLETPKPLLKVGENYLIIDQINRLQAVGVEEMIINVSHFGEQIKAALMHHKSNLRIHFIDEPFPYGTGGALVNAQDHLGVAPFILCNADIFSSIDLDQLPQTTDFAHLIGVPNPSHNKSGDFSLSDKTVVINTTANEWTWSGLSLINPQILIDHNKQKFPFDIWNTVLKPLIAQLKITAHIEQSMWMDIGTIERLELARACVKDEN